VPVPHAATAHITVRVILDEAQRQSIAIRRQGRDIAIVLSVRQYERLRAAAVSEFHDRRNNTAREASAAGLTEDRLSELLNGD
jgi:hypothetical protein